MEENHCHYISSMGIRKSADLYDLASIDNIDGYDFTKLKQTNIVYIKTDAIPAFSKVNISVGIILVTGCSDYTMPDDMFANESDFLAFVENPQILRWYVQNCVYTHPKIERLPIGLDYHTMREYPHWGSQKTPVEQERELMEVVKQGISFEGREIAIYSNCHFLTWTKFGGDRTAALATIPAELMVLEESPCERAISWRRQIKYAFVLSPHGNGLDCHRTWEALILGCIPIVKTSAIDSLYDDLPVVLVKDWSEITREFLEGVVADFRGRTFHYEKLTLEYWRSKMRS
jgi:hypothetical protein